MTILTVTRQGFKMGFAIQEILDEGILCDFVLIAGADSDAETKEPSTSTTETSAGVKAHKLILAAASGVFRQQFSSGGVSLIRESLIVPNASHEDLENMVRFIYKGRLEIDSASLPHFLVLARQLELKGLENYLDENSNDNNRKRESSSEEGHPKIKVKKEPNEGGDDVDDEWSPSDTMQQPSSTSGAPIRRQLHGTLKLPDGGGQCMTCGLKFTQYGNCKTHFSDKHVPQDPIECHICFVKSKTDRYWKAHMKAKHGIGAKALRMMQQNQKLKVPTSVKNEDFS